MSATATPKTNDSGFPLVSVPTRYGVLDVTFLGCLKVDDYYDQGGVTVTGPVAHVESRDGEGITVNGIAYRVSMSAGFSNTHNRKAERDANGDYPRHLGWHPIAGNYGTVYRVGTYTGPTDKARGVIHDLLLDVIEIAAGQEPDAPRRAEINRRLFEAERERKRAADLRTQANEAETRAHALSMDAGNVPTETAALVVKS